MLEELTGIPVVGVIPYMDLDLDDEDSLAQRFQKNHHSGTVEIAVIRLPRLSNFTDFNPLERMPEVSLRYVRSRSELGAPDLIVLPGTKSTIADLRWLWETGLADGIISHAKHGCPVIGICGGYQMLGNQVFDPNQEESGGEAKGLGLLDMETTFYGEKTRTRVNGTVEHAQGLFDSLNGQSFYGYEIHMGQTAQKETTFSCLDNGNAEGGAKGNIWGSYVHGIFDCGEFAAAVVNCLLGWKGLPQTAHSIDWSASQERQLDQLAEQVRQHLDINLIHTLIGR
jgi:adenosylcobyric acid synthase